MAAATTTTRPRITREDRYTRDDRCPNCGGWQSGGHGEHCYGVRSKDGSWASCSEIPNGLPAPDGPLGTWWHAVGKPCRCGQEHGQAPERTADNGHGESQPTAKRKRVRYPNIRAMFADGWHETNRWRYENADGTLHHYEVRYDPPTASAGRKRYHPWQQIEDGAWVMDEEGLKHILYGLPELLAAPAHRPIFIPEGPKCVEALRLLGLLATCNEHGADVEGAKWTRTEGRHEALRDRHVIILPDNDPEKPDKPHESRKGQRHAAAIAADLAGVAKSVRILELPGLPEKGDVYDWLADGHTKDELLELALTTPVIGGGHTVQDDTPAPVSQQWQDRARIAEKTVENLRKEQALTTKILARPDTEISAKHKLATILMRTQIVNKPRDDQGRVRVFRGEIASGLGVSPQTARRYLDSLEKHGIIHQENVQNPTHPALMRWRDRQKIEAGKLDELEPDEAIVITPGPAFDAPESIAPDPDRKKQGGARPGAGRKRKCACGSEDLYVVARTVTEVHCRQCGEITVEDAGKERIVYDSREEQAEQEENQVDFDTTDDAPGGDDTTDSGEEFKLIRDKTTYAESNQFENQLDFASADSADEAPHDGEREALLDVVRTYATELNYPALRIASARITIAPTAAAWDAYLARADIGAVWALLEALEAIPGENVAS